MRDDLFYAAKWKPVGSGMPGDNGASFTLYAFKDEKARNQWAKLGYRQVIKPKDYHHFDHLEPVEMF